MGLNNASHNSSRPSGEELPPGCLVPNRQSTQSQREGKRKRQVRQGVREFSCRVHVFICKRTLGPCEESQKKEGIKGQEFSSSNWFGPLGSFRHPFWESILRGSCPLCQLTSQILYSDWSLFRSYLSSVRPQLELSPTQRFLWKFRTTQQGQLLA